MKYLLVGVLCCAFLGLINMADRKFLGEVREAKDILFIARNVVPEMESRDLEGLYVLKDKGLRLASQEEIDRKVAEYERKAKDTFTLESMFGGLFGPPEYVAASEFMEGIRSARGTLVRESDLTTKRWVFLGLALAMAAMGLLIKPPMRVADMDKEEVAEVKRAGRRSATMFFVGTAIALALTAMGIANMLDISRSQRDPSSVGALFLIAALLLSTGVRHWRASNAWDPNGIEY